MNGQQRSLTPVVIIASIYIGIIQFIWFLIGHFNGELLFVAGATFFALPLIALALKSGASWDFLIGIYYKVTRADREYLGIWNVVITWENESGKEARTGHLNVIRTLWGIQATGSQLTNMEIEGQRTMESWNSEGFSIEKTRDGSRILSYIYTTNEVGAPGDKKGVVVAVQKSDETVFTGAFTDISVDKSDQKFRTGQIVLQPPASPAQ